MLVQRYMDRKGISQYRLSKNSGIPYTTINDICSGRAQLEKCSAETIYKISKELDVSMEDLLAPYLEKRSSFELYKSNVCHRLKELGDINFIVSTLESGDIRKYYDMEWYPECLYLLAMLDYVSRENDVPLCSEYNDIRKCKLNEPVYPSGIITASQISGNDDIKDDAFNSAIPEFRRFNIIENEVRNIV